ncbi:MAG: bifunctional phosphoserine phosphatase/homoserine phosphotransferase ThrH [Spirochaetales bacterium]|nr:bifunctional phosphoserine phosphatase/homoserine phosphotransferase ThrH [Spirochaetales bacterium]
MNIVCLDLEGVLIPEIWIKFAQKTGIEELRLTTRDISDYDVLMKKRISILKENNLRLKDIQEVIATMDPFEGSLEFVRKIKEVAQLVILSDTFVEFADPMMKKLERPTLFCNSLDVNADGFIEAHKIRIKDGKRKAIEAFKQINLNTIAAGDSYNDLTMIQTANAGAFFKPPQSITTENPEIPVLSTYYELENFILNNLK